MSRETDSDEPRATATYVYCLARAPSPPALGGAPTGLPGAGPPRAIAAGGELWLVASTVPLADYDEPAIEAGLQDVEWVGERAAAHQAVVELVAGRTTVVPMQLFTLFRDDRRAVEELGGRRDELAAIFDRLAGREEWGVRAHFDAERARSFVGDGEAATSGRDYLRRKQRQRDLPRLLAGQAREAAEALFRRLDEQADAATRRAGGDGMGSLLLDAAFLVSASRHDAFERLVEEESNQLGATAPVVVTLSGPFPPYSFVGGPPSAHGDESGSP